MTEEQHAAAAPQPAAGKAPEEKTVTELAKECHALIGAIAKKSSAKKLLLEIRLNLIAFNSYKRKR